MMDNNDPRAPRMVEALQFEDKVWELRAQHKTYKQMAEITGKSVRGVAYALERAQKRYNASLREKVEATLGLQLERLDKLAGAYLAEAIAGDVKKGELYLKTLERIDKLVGLEKRAPEEDKPIALSVNISSFSDERLEELRKLKKDIERASRGSESQGEEEEVHPEAQE
jgi:hypothetical protein